VHWHGFYWRFVILASGVRKRFGIYRCRCVVCGRTVSFLPDFCVPHKHFGTDVIEAVLAAVLLSQLSVRAAARWNSLCNTAGFSRTCAGEWVAHFRRNSHNLWHFGLARLGVSVAGEGRSCAALLLHLRGFGTGETGCAEHRLRIVQCALSAQYPPFGLLRAQLLPGCFT
jgi:hypothetical protein